MSGEFDVVTEELRTAAGDIQSAVGPVSAWAMSAGGASATGFGHDQVADMYTQLCAKLTEAVSGAAQSATQAATDLDATAASYDTTDASAGATLGGFGGLVSTGGTP